MSNHSFPPKKICGPFVTVSICAFGEIQIAETSGVRATKGLPCAGPSSSSVVEKPSEIAPVEATTLTANWESRGRPVSGSIMYRGIAAQQRCWCLF